MSSDISMEALAARGEAALAHYGVRGMKWGVRKKSSSGGSTSKLTPTQKSTIIAFAGVGASVAATIMAGPIAGTSVSALSKLISIKTSTSSPTVPTGPGSDGKYDFELNDYGKLIPTG